MQPWVFLKLQSQIEHGINAIGNNSTKWITLEILRWDTIINRMVLIRQTPSALRAINKLIIIGIFCNRFFMYHLSNANVITIPQVDFLLQSP